MLYDKIKSLADERGLTIRQVERAAELGNGTIGGWRTAAPTLENLRKVAVVLQVPVSVLIEE